LQQWNHALDAFREEKAEAKAGRGK